MLPWQRHILFYHINLVVEMGNRIVEHFIRNPRALFLTDCIGAFTTSFSLFFFLRNMEDYFAMPADILVALSIVAAGFCLYSGSCFLILKRNWSPYLRVIMIANCLYCLLTIAFLVANYPVLTMLDMIYFCGEILIIAILVLIEFKVSRMAI